MLLVSKVPFQQTFQLPAMLPSMFVNNNGSGNRPRPIIIPPVSPDSLSARQVVMHRQQYFHEKHRPTVPFFLTRSAAPAPAVRMAASTPQMMRLAATDEDLMRMEQEVEASHMAARMTLARMRAARAMQISREEKVEELVYQQQNRLRNAGMTLSHRIQQSQHPCPRIVSPSKQAHHLQPTQQKLEEAPSLPGLDLLHTASLSIASEASSHRPSTPKQCFGPSSNPSLMDAKDAVHAPAMPNPVRREESSIASVDTNISTPSLHDEPLASDAQRIYIDQIRPTDILCGRGGRSNHHPGNKRYRRIVGNIKFAYQQCPAKGLKTDLSRAIVGNCYSYGARFIKEDSTNGRYCVLTKAEARKKTAQALRETKALKWTC